MKENIVLKAELRNEFGKNSCHRLRKKGKIPANILQRGKATAVSIEAKQFEKLLKRNLLPSMKIQVELEGQVFEVLPKEVQRDPVTGSILHVDLYRMTENHKFHLHVPIELVGVSKGVKSGGALEHYIQMLKIRTTPENLKEKIEVNIENLNVGDAIRLNDLNLPKQWDILIRGNPIICKVSATRTAKVEETQQSQEEKRK